MGLGAGALLLVAGVVLTYGVDADIPYIDDGAIGSMLMAAGVVLLAVGLVVHVAKTTDGGMTDAGAGLLLFGVGAVLAFALDIDVPFVWDWALGVILMVGGAVAMAAAVYMQHQQTRTKRVVHDRYGAPYDSNRSF